MPKTSSQIRRRLFCREANAHLPMSVKKEGPVQMTGNVPRSTITAIAVITCFLFVHVERCTHESKTMHKMQEASSTGRTEVVHLLSSGMDAREQASAFGIDRRTADEVEREGIRQRVHPPWKDCGSRTLRGMRDVRATEITSRGLFKASRSDLFMCTMPQGHGSNKYGGLK